ncbi:MAG TPA: hypothetical protein VD908_05555, partial [Cytophagales bacterium]|nr:hypothetical protein [Cytophagales bacterium]
IGLKNAHNIIYNGALALLFFNTVTFLVSLYFFKKESALFKFRNRVLYTMLIITSALPFFYSVMTDF